LFRKILIALIILVTIYFIYYVFFTSNRNNDFSLDAIIESTAPKKYAIISTSLVDDSKYYYMLYIPICCIAWRRIGYEPLVLIVNNPQSTVSPLANKTIEYLEKFKIRIVYVPVAVENVRQMGMFARIYAGALPNEIIKEEDYIITTDSDLIPVSKSHFNLFNTHAITVHMDAFNNGYFTHNGKEVEMYTMAYIGMRKWQWKEVMNISKDMTLNGEAIINKLKKIHGDKVIRKNNEIAAGDDVWYLDQKTVTLAINDYLNDPKFRHQRKLNKVKFTGIRLDRSDSPRYWYLKLALFSLINDAHMYHADSKKKIKLIVDFLELVFNKNICDKLKIYFNEFFSLL
jgi:hypothetical protein